MRELRENGVPFERAAEADVFTQCRCEGGFNVMLRQDGNRLVIEPADGEPEFTAHVLTGDEVFSGKYQIFEVGNQEIVLVPLSSTN